MQILNLRRPAFFDALVAPLFHQERVRGRVVAGLVDAGLASLATFSVALYAVRALSPELLGAYAIYFTAFGLAGLIAPSLYLLPVRVAALQAEPRSRIALLPHSLLVGAIFGGVAALLTPFAGVFALGDLPAEKIAPLGVTAAGLVFISPLQDHFRITLHLSMLSWYAAATSALQLVAVLTSLLALPLASVPPQWVPYGTLVMANCVSFGTGMWLVKDHIAYHRLELPHPRSLARSGWSFLLLSIIPACAQLLSSGMVATFKSVQTVGYAEASRVVAAPIFVASIGLWQALSPGLMEAGRTRSRHLAVRMRRIFLLALLPLCAAYMLLVGWPEPFNPMQRLVPAAYQLEGLVLLSGAAVLAVGIDFIPRSEMTGAQQEDRLVMPAVAGSLLQLAVVGICMWFLGAYVIPVALVANGVLATVWTFVRAEKLFSE